MYPVSLPCTILDRNGSVFPGFAAVLIASTLLLIGVRCSAQSEADAKTVHAADVLTNHNGIARTGADLHERILNPGNVNPDHFGKLFSLAVDGQIYAQPLYMAEVAIKNSGQHNVLFVATAHDSVFAFDADDTSGLNAKPLWHTTFIKPRPGTAQPLDIRFKPTTVSAVEGATPVPSVDFSFPIEGAYQDLVPEIGITGTPVIDPTRARLYVVAATRENGKYIQRLHALDIGSGEECMPPAEIRGSVPGIGDDSVSGVLPFAPRQHLQRPGLLFEPKNDLVYVAFGSHGDRPTNGFEIRNLFNLLPGYHGWVFAYDAKTLKQQGVFCSTPNGGTAIYDFMRPAAGGIWMSGAAPAADKDGNVYFSTGNGTFDAISALGNHDDYGDSILKMTFRPEEPVERSLSISGFYTPPNQSELNNSDLDVGSCGVLLLPEGSDEHPNLLVTGSKAGVMYLVDRLQMGGYDPKKDTSVQSFQATESTETTRNQQDSADHKMSAREKSGADHHRVDQTALLKKLSTKNTKPELSNIHGAPVFWHSDSGSYVYVWGEVDVLKAFTYAQGQFDWQNPAKGLVALSDGMPGGMLSLSANGADPNSGILWVTHPYRGDANLDTVRGVLQAFDATPVPSNTQRYLALHLRDKDASDDNAARLRLLWDSRGDSGQPEGKGTLPINVQGQGDEIGTFAKFSPPTVANGKVYVPSFSGQVSVYGLFKSREQPTFPLQSAFVKPVPDPMAQAGADRRLYLGRAKNTLRSALTSCIYLQFDLSKVTTRPRSALLTLEIENSSLANQRAAKVKGALAVNRYALVNLYHIPDAKWSEQQITWDNAPGLNQANVSSKGQLVASHYVIAKMSSVTFDITELITQVLNGEGSKVITLQLISMVPDNITLDFIRGNTRSALGKVGAPALSLTSY